MTRFLAAADRAGLGVFLLDGCRSRFTIGVRPGHFLSVVFFAGIDHDEGTS
jgi:hypothetical protein